MKVMQISVGFLGWRGLGGGRGGGAGESDINDQSEMIPSDFPFISTSSSPARHIQRRGWLPVAAGWSRWVDGELQTTASSPATTQHLPITPQTEANFRKAQSSSSRCSQAAG